MAYEYPRDVLLREFETVTDAGVLSLRDTWIEISETVFFASMIQDEGHAVRVAVVYVEGGASALESVQDTASMAPFAELAWRVTKIEQQVLTPQLLAKLSRGIEYGEDLIVVGGRSPQLFVDGISRRDHTTNGGGVIRIAAPRIGVLVFEQGDDELMRFEAGRRVPTAVELLYGAGPVQEALAAINPFNKKLIWRSPERRIVSDVLRHMRLTGSGGLLAILPTAPTPAELADVTYKLADPEMLRKRVDAAREADSTLFLATPGLPEQQETAELFAKRGEQERLHAIVEGTTEMVGKLSAIDGAVLMGPMLSVYGAGYMVESKARPVVLVADDAEAKNLKPKDLRHGARHRAAFAFADDHPGGVAFVVSEDGPVRCALRIGDDVVTWSVRIPET